MRSYTVHPDAHCQFGARGASFRLVTGTDAVDAFTLAPSACYRDSRVVGLAPDEPLAAALGDGRCPPGSDVLVVCPDRFLVSPDEADVGDRRLSVMPCGSTPVTPDQVAYFLSVVERSDPVALDAACERLFAAMERSGEVTLVDAGRGTSASFRPSEDYEWNQQAGVLEPGEQQIAPAGEASALAAGILDFDPTRRLAVTGTLAVSGTPIVHRGEKTDPGKQAELFGALSTLAAGALVLELVDGLVVDVRPHDPSAEPVARRLAELYEADPAYRVLWEFGVGLNTEIRPQPGNCGMNEMYGADGGVLHLGFGLTPSTEFALTFFCPDTLLTDAAGSVVCGGDERRGARRLNVRRSASCGCQ